jgi:hypothetical protein
MTVLVVNFSKNTGMKKMPPSKVHVVFINTSTVSHGRSDVLEPNRFVGFLLLFG